MSLSALFVETCLSLCCLSLPPGRIQLNLDKNVKNKNKVKVKYKVKMMIKVVKMMIKVVKTLVTNLQ